MFVDAVNRLIRIAPVVTAISLMAGNLGLLLRRGLHPNLETMVGFLWIASDYVLRQKPRHPIAAPRLNAAGIVLGSLLLSASGFHAKSVDWDRVRTPFGYVPAAAAVGLQNELRRYGQQLAGSQSPTARLFGPLFRRPYALSAILSFYGVLELMRSALHIHDAGLLAISIAYGTGIVFLSLFDHKEKRQEAQVEF